MSFYKGYILTENKKPLEKFANKTHFKTLEMVKGLPEYAGIISSRSILIDIDDMEQSEKFFSMIKDQGIKCHVLRSRSGMHFLFKNKKISKCYTDITLACGIRSDIKCGKKNCYEVLKIGGVEREILQACSFEEADELPKWAYPVKCSVDFMSMKEGGRNSALFSYILTLQSQGFTMDETRQAIRLLNKFTLPCPLGDDELDIILRDAAFSKPVFFDDGRFLHDVFGDYLIDKENIKRINGQLHIFDEGLYRVDQRRIENAMLKHLKGITSTRRKEVLNYLDVKLMMDHPEAPPNLIGFKNGVLDINTMEMREYSPDVIMTNQIPWSYNPYAYSKTADDALDRFSCFDREIRAQLEELIGACLYRSNTLGGGGLFVLTGEGSNGKSTYISMLENILGEDNRCALSLQQLSERFMKFKLAGKMANLGDDIPGTYIKDSSDLKKAATGDLITAEDKGKTPFSFRSYATLIFSANELPQVKDRSDGFKRRCRIIPFNAKFKKGKNFNPNIREELATQETMEYLINLGVKALQNVLKNKAFTESIKGQEEEKEYEKMNNPIIEFIEMCDFHGEILNHPPAELYQKYERFCHLSGFTGRLTRPNFTKQICKRLKLTTNTKKINGEVIRIFIDKQ